MAIQLTLLFPVPRWAGAITKLLSNINISKKVGVNNNLTKMTSKSIQ